jgi:tetratricopeptide (TPR) repeat protein
VAHAALEAGDGRAAAASFERALRRGAHAVDALNDLAWLRATHADSALRNATQAVHLAERACALTNWDQPMTLDTLAAAYAEAGRFDAACATADRALRLARAAGQTEMEAALTGRIEGYRRHQAYRWGEADGEERTP